MRTDTTIYRSRVRQRQSPRRIALRRAVFLTAAVVLLAVLVGLAFAGRVRRSRRGRRSPVSTSAACPRRKPCGMLSARAAAVERKPVTFTAGGKSFPLSASQLGVAPDWRAAVRVAAAEGGGFGPMRGFKRLRARLFGLDVAPLVHAYDAAVHYKLDQIGRARRPERCRREARAHGSCSDGWSRAARAASSTALPQPRSFSRLSAASIAAPGPAPICDRRAGGSRCRPGGCCR